MEAEAGHFISQHFVLHLPKFRRKSWSVLTSSRILLRSLGGQRNGAYHGCPAGANDIANASEDEAALKGRSETRISVERSSRQGSP